MPYKDPDIRRQKQTEAARRRKEALRQADPEAYERFVRAQQKRSKEHYKKNKEAVDEKNRQWYLNNPERAAELRRARTNAIPMDEYKQFLDAERRKKADQMAKWLKTPQGQRSKAKTTLKKKFEVYGLTIDQYDNMYNAQKGKCAICETDGPQYGHNRLHVDHCHSTGKVRSLLCGGCNSGIGRFNDNIETMFKAVEYIKWHRLG